MLKQVGSTVGAHRLLPPALISPGRLSSRHGRLNMLCCFFFQAEDGIRDLTVTGVQTCALPISGRRSARGHSLRCLRTSSSRSTSHSTRRVLVWPTRASSLSPCAKTATPARPLCRSEERRVGKEGRSRWSPYH